MDPAVIREAIKRMQEAEAVFETTVGASDNAPPDPGFPRRIRAVGEASLQRAEALSEASLIPGFRWTPVSDPHPAIRSHELRPGGNRPGPPHKWQSYDMAVERLSIAAQGNVISLVADEFPRDRMGRLMRSPTTWSRAPPSAWRHRTSLQRLTSTGGANERM